MEVKIFKGIIIDTPTYDKLRIREDHYIGVENNIIKFVEKELPEEYREAAVTELGKGEFLLPGLVDCHAHPPQYAFIGTAFGLPLLEWLKETVHNYEPKCASTEYAEKLYTKFVNKAIENGTTTAAYFATIHVESSKILARICEERNMRAFIGKVNQDQNFPDSLREETDKSVEQTIEFIDSFKEFQYVKPIVTPRFAVSCTRELMARLGEIAQEKNVFMQTHLSESPGECELIKEMYPECSNYTDVYEKYNCLNDKTLLAHSIHLSDEEMDVIKQKGSSIIHCPSANLLMKSGFCLVKKVLEKGMKIGLGTDVAGGSSVSLVEAMKLGLMVGNINNIIKADDATVSLSEILYLATLGGARCLDLDKEIGTFEAGKKFDCLRVDLNSPHSPVELFEWNSTSHLLERFILQGDSRNIKQVYIDGKLVKESF